MNEKNPRIPKVGLAKPHNRPYQLRYTDPETRLQVRISTRTTDKSEASEQKKKLEAKLLLGLDAKPAKPKVAGPGMDWKEFRERYRKIHLVTVRPTSRLAAESRLDIAERIVKPKTLGDLNNSEALHELQSKLLAGAESDLDTRSPHTVRSYMVAIVSVLNWAAEMEWVPSVPRVRKIKVSKRKGMKGRELTQKEFNAMLNVVLAVVGDEAEASWKYLLRALWESGLRIEELMKLHWLDENYIVPKWKQGSLPVLAIPSQEQKNDTEESIPLLPGFESLLLETPKAERFGWVVNPMSLQVRLGRRVRHQRSNSEWIAKIVTRIGKKAGIIVNLRDEKFASSHDLRRSCGCNLVAAGVPEREVSKVLRHASLETTRKFYTAGNVEQSAQIIRDVLTVPGNSEQPKST